jgi:3-hydroxyisobutyrate dehydrogenase
MTRVAFLGTGTMGLPMARNLLKNGFEVQAWNRTLERARPLESHGAKVFDDPREAAAGCELLVTMLSDTVAVLDSAAGALPSLSYDAVWVQMSTVGLEGTRLCEETAGEAGVQFVDAPVLGTREPAEKGELVVLASGPGDTRERLQELFDAVGKRTLWLGDAGQATRGKVVINSWIVGVVAVLAETITLAESLDVDPQVFFEAVEGGTLDLAYARMKGRAMIEKAFDDPSFRLALSRKDADLVLDAAEQGRLELPVIEAARERLRRAEEGGHGDEDMAATYWASRPEHVPAGSRMARVPRA